MSQKTYADLIKVRKATAQHLLEEADSLYQQGLEHLAAGGFTNVAISEFAQADDYLKIAWKQAVKCPMLSTGTLQRQIADLQDLLKRRIFDAVVQREKDQ